jgi:hypothetical protein
VTARDVAGRMAGGAASSRMPTAVRRGRQLSSATASHGGSRRACRAGADGGSCDLPEDDNALVEAVCAISVERALNAAAAVELTTT